MQCISLFDDNGRYPEHDGPHECQLGTGHIAIGISHACHCGMRWMGGTNTADLLF